jgi:hypothetical protein
MLVQFEADIPPTLNEQIRDARANKFKSSSVKKALTAEIAKGLVGLHQFPGKVWIDFLWKVKNFGSDPDNIDASRKYLMDGAVMAALIKKDSLMIIQSPIIHDYIRGDNTVRVRLSDRPLWRLISLVDEQTLEDS